MSIVRELMEIMDIGLFSDFKFLRRGDIKKKVSSMRRREVLLEAHLVPELMESLDFTSQKKGNQKVQSVCNRKELPPEAHSESVVSHFSFVFIFSSFVLFGFQLPEK